MTSKFRNTIVMVGVVAATAARVVTAQYVERTIETVRTTEVQVLTSGPVHEAFAETIVNDPEPDLVIVQYPPEPIAEDPPDEIPDGPNMTWIPGYWAWDDDRNDFLWVSGIWRSVPPGRSYIPGFWSRSAYGFQWSSGFWVDSDATDIEYLPEPPDPVEAGPPPPSPSPNLIWTSGIWTWDQDRYAWRPGHWVEASPNWMWIPAHYVWSPRGYVFVDGYWDFPVEDRGVLFAPVYISPVVRMNRTYVYAPATVIDLDVFTDHLFVRPRYSHYYFGDYYAATYIDRGIYPWFSVQARRVAYDPIYAQRCWRHRDEPDWRRSVEVSYDRRRDDVRQRPPRTLDVQLHMGDRGEVAVKGFIVAKTLQQVAQANRARFRTVSQSEREVNVQKARAASKTSEERKSIESRDTDTSPEPAKRTAPVRAKLPPPTVTAKKETPTNKAPAPKKPEATAVDRTVQPKPKPKVQRVTPTQPATVQPVQPQPSPTPAARPDSPAPPPAAKPVAPPQPATRVAPTAKPQPDRPDSDANKAPANPTTSKAPEKSPPKNPPPGKSGKTKKDDKDKDDNDNKDKKDKDDD